MSLPCCIQTIHERVTASHPGRRIQLLHEAYRTAGDREAFVLALIGELVTTRVRLETLETSGTGPAGGLIP